MEVVNWKLYTRIHEGSLPGGGCRHLQGIHSDTCEEDDPQVLQEDRAKSDIKVGNCVEEAIPLIE